MQQIGRVGTFVDGLRPLGQRPLGDGAHGGQQVFGAGGGGHVGGHVDGIHDGTPSDGIQAMEMVKGTGLRMVLATGE